MGLLADLMVKFSVGGAADVAGAMGKVKDGLAGVQVSVSKLDLVFQAVIGKIVDQVEHFARAGLAASATGQVLDFQLERLSRTIAGLFGPEIRKVVELVERLNNWIEKLSEKQKAGVAHWIEGGAAALAFAAVLPQVVAGAQAAAAAIETLTIVVATGEAALGDWAGLVAVLAGGLASLGAGAVVGQGGIGALWETLKPLVQTLKTIGEHIAAVFAPLLPVLERVYAAFLGLLDAFGGLAESFADLVEPLLDLVAELMVSFVGLGEVLVRIASLVVWVLSFVMKLFNLLAWLLRVLNDFLFGLFGRDLKIDFGKAEKSEGGRDALSRPAGGATSPDQIWMRLAQASIMGTAGKSVAQQQLDVQQQQLDAQKDTTAAVRGVQPAFTR